LADRKLTWNIEDLSPEHKHEIRENAGERRIGTAVTYFRYRGDLPEKVAELAPTGPTLWAYLSFLDGKPPGRPGQ
jgi:hypothetical protein